jgi:hypothetical protein
MIILDVWHLLVRGKEFSNHVHKLVIKIIRHNTVLYCDMHAVGLRDQQRKFNHCWEAQL